MLAYILQTILKVVFFVYGLYFRDVSVSYTYCVFSYNVILHNIITFNHILIKLNEYTLKNESVTPYIKLKKVLVSFPKMFLHIKQT